MRTSDFDYHLPPHLIAQTPAEPRDSSRLLVLDRSSRHMEHRLFRDLPQYLRRGDVLVFNDSRVIPARLHARREGTGGKAELLLLSRVEPGVWKAIGRPGRRLTPGARLLLEGTPGADVWVEVLEASADGTRTVALSSDDGIDLAGQVPLPPYIHTPLADPERYQTVYAREPGSAAAPTAGLHFTPEMLRGLEESGVELVYVTLHVGLDTFRPLRSDDPREHTIHGEYFQVSPEAAASLAVARAEGRRIVAVGTTSVRVLEQIALGSRDGALATSGWTELYMLPGHQFRMVDALVTNFHLPRTTLLMLVSAFAGRELVLEAYREAIAQEYRFYSFGDGMLIV